MPMNFYPPFRNRKDTVINQGDACELSVAIIDAAGLPISLTKNVDGLLVFRDLYWHFRGGSKYPSNYYSAATPILGSDLVFTRDDYVDLVDAVNGYVSVNIPAGLLVDCRTYNHFLLALWPGDDQDKAVNLASGKVNVRSPLVARTLP